MKGVALMLLHRRLLSLVQDDAAVLHYNRTCPKGIVEESRGNLALAQAR